jgi:hypothetical protein
MVHLQLVPLFEDLASLRGTQFAPGSKSCVCRFNGGLGFLAATIRYLGNLTAVIGIENGKFTRTVDPLAVDVSLGMEEFHWGQYLVWKEDMEPFLAQFKTCRVIM